MLAAHPGSFFFYVTKTPTFIGSLLGSRANSDQAVNDRLDRYAEASSRRSKTQQLLTSPQTQVQKFVYPGGGVTVQPAVEAITDELVRVTPNFDGGRELLMLSELQGQFAFVLYDSSKKQAFAARDPSGAEPLYYKIDEDGGVQYTNALEQLPSGDAERRSWKELQPGHYMLGKTVAQFALSLRQLETRERKESQDADALHAMLQRGSDTREEERSSFSVRSLLRNRSK